MDPSELPKLCQDKVLRLIYSHIAWDSQIKPNLIKMAKKQFTSKQIIEKLKQFYYMSYTHRELVSRKRQSFTFKQLYKKYSKELPQLFSDIAALILDFQEQARKIPLLIQGPNQVNQITFNKKQMLQLVCLMATCLICSQQIKIDRKFPSRFDFSFVFSEDDYKTTAIVEFLKIQLSNLAKLKDKYEQQYLVLKRLKQQDDINQIVNLNKNKPILLPKIANDNQSIQDYFGEIKVDFANKFIGGGALGQGCVQEEIMFTNHPQMFTSVLFCEVMKENQAIQFRGYKKYINNKGYGYTASFNNLEKHQYQYEEKKIAKEYIVAIDALHYQSKKHDSEFSVHKINRQLYKAYVGFHKSGTIQDKIVTGNWGCGAFNGDLHLKFIIQLLASSMAGKQLVYCPFGFKNKLINEKLFDKIKNLTAGQLYKIIIDFSQQLSKDKNIYRLLDSKI